MKIAFVGKGGSGKTTLSALFARFLAREDLPVVAIDADINQHLAAALGMDEQMAAGLPPMGLKIDRIKEYLRGENPRIKSNQSMTKTTPPGSGSRLVRLQEDNPIYSYFERKVEGIRIMATGPFSEEDLGLKCYHSKVGAAEMLINHLLDGKDEYLIVDMTAGADSFASGMFTKFDLTILVAESTLKGLSVYTQFKQYAKNYDVKIAVLGNKVEDQDDIDFLREQAGDDLLAVVRRSNFIRSMEKGRHLPLSELEPENLAVLKDIKQAVDSRPKDWAKFYRQTVEFHIKNALGWANATAGEDLTKQVDPDFELKPDLAVR